MAKETVFTPRGWMSGNMVGCVIDHPRFGTGLVTDQVTRRTGLTERITLWSILWSDGTLSEGVGERFILESRIFRSDDEKRRYATWTEATSGA